MTEHDRRTLERLEEELWREETRFDVAYMRRVIAEDFFEFGRSGRFYTLEDTLATPREPIDVVLPLPDFAARLLSPDVAQVTYKSIQNYRGEVLHAQRCSIWSRRGDRWVLRFHQGTPLPSA